MSGFSLAALVLALITPPADVARTTNVAYMPGERGTLDVYQPRQPHAGAPEVVFFYGGGWTGGDKGLYRFIGRALASEGFVAIIPDYRIYPNVRFPAFLEDNARAVRWARDHAASLGADPDRLFLMGHSAGAYEAAMLALDRRWLAQVGLDPRRDVRGVIALSGPYDFLPLHSDTLKGVFGPADALAQTQPINHVDGQAPPTLLAAGGADKTVDPANTLRLAARIEATGGHAETVIYPGASHTKLILAFLPLLQGRVNIRRRTADFIRRQAADAPAKAAA